MHVDATYVSFRWPLKLTVLTDVPDGLAAGAG